MSILKILLIVLLIVIVCALIYYGYTISQFKKFIQFEAELKNHPSDELVKEYMKRYKKIFIPNQPQIKESRGQVYKSIKSSDQVSYEVKKELRQFFENEGINTMTTLKNQSEKIEEKE